MPDHRIHSSIVKKTDGKQQVVYAEVYSPLRIDTDKEAMEADQIAISAHNFLLKGRHNNIDICHDFKPSGCKIIDSFIADPVKHPDFIPGSWVIGVKVYDPVVWQKIEKGELNGFSFGTTQPATRTLVLIEKSHPVVGYGLTEFTGAGLLPPHQHPVRLKFDDYARPIATLTDEVFGHTHRITHTTATDLNLDHAHRLIFEVN